MDPSKEYIQTMNSIDYATRCHCQSGRFMIASLYEDSIYSIIEGLLALGVTLYPDGSSISNCAPFKSHHEEKKISPPDVAIVDCNPSGVFGFTQTVDELTISMIYNLALSYHLSGLSHLQGNSTYATSLLKEALRLYKEAEHRIFDHESIITVPFAGLENNILHVTCNLARLITRDT